ncbi:MAG TPA: hypothetical protein PKG54_06225 [Phycisphaerae bacterium]|nr:hypothetical protein [Phycisphaerae bacterium]HOJ56124.1 hypothetical protein [Phycisphaerae bacterium]HOL28038.1 hypothetical protein [Phycisphaerae bacterium]HPP22298.1 hypothetical protein [Phycisphaerae bacterium]HQA44608.1 hypothetical protein [Phycisphaerae bacterium]
MVRVTIIAQLCAAGLALAEVASVPAGGSEAVECPLDSGYIPAAPAIPGGDKPVTLDTPIVEPGPVALPASAVYAEPVRKTFFAYLAAGSDRGGKSKDGGSPGKSPLRVSYFDHARSTVPRPAILPLDGVASVVPAGVSLALDEQGYVWVCASPALAASNSGAGNKEQPTTQPAQGAGAAAVGTQGQPTILFRSSKPHDIRAFTRHAGPPMADARLYHLGEQGFLLIGLRDRDGGSIPCFATSPDGRSWSEPRQLADIDANHSLVTAFFKGKTGATKVGVALAAWPAGKSPLMATNLYYVETPDGGKTWQSIRRIPLNLPVRGNENGVLAWDYKSMRWTVYLKDMELDSAGNPSIVFIGGRGGTGRIPLMCTWIVGRWVGREWETNGVIPAAGPFDATAFQILPDRSWLQLVARNTSAPRQAHEEVVLWSSNDQGRAWYKQAWVSSDPSIRHALVRPLNASPELFALAVIGLRGIEKSIPPFGEHPGFTKPPIDATRLLFHNARGDSLMLPLAMPDSEARLEPIDAPPPQTQPK